MENMNDEKEDEELDGNDARNCLTVLAVIIAIAWGILVTNDVLMMKFSNTFLFWRDDYTLTPDCDTPWDCLHMTKDEWWKGMQEINIPITTSRPPVEPNN